MAAGVRNFITPRIVGPLVLWLIAIWLTHRYFFSVPVSVPSIVVETPPQVTTDILGALRDAAFPVPPRRNGEDDLDSVDPLFRPFEPLLEPDAPFPVLRPTAFLPKACLESWFIYGELDCSGKELGPETTLDATWLWVNGTDIRWMQEMLLRSRELDLKSPVRHFREQNELKYSMRSVVQALKGHLGTLHLVLYDYAFNATTDFHLLPESTKQLLERDYGQGERNAQGVSPGVAQHLEENWRIVQTPQWLNFTAVRSSDGNAESPDTDVPTLRYASHSEIFHLPSTHADQDEPGEHAWMEARWREKALPTFNSMVLESRLGWLPGLADVSIALNDDFFIVREVSVSDFYSPIYGTVIRFNPIYLDQVKPAVETWQITESGENGGLYHANELLSKRFPKRLRPYFAHAPKVVTRNLHHEASLMFEEPLTLSSTRAFREVPIGDGDIQIQWMLTLLRVERWREAMLWTWIVANLGSETGKWEEGARQKIKDLFGLTPEDGDVAQIEVHRGERWTMKKERIADMFNHAGWDAPAATDYLFSSMDGHLPPILKPDSKEDNDVCVIDLDECFGDFWSWSSSVPADKMFKRLTFEKPECGDCLIMALVTASGPLGLSAVFPPASATFRNSDQSSASPPLPPPHLPLTPTWEEADFSLQSVMWTTALPGQQVNLREYCMYLLSRYLYISAKSEVNFSMLKTPDQSKEIFDELDKNRDTAILGLNDDIEKGYDKIKAMMGNWFESRWSEPTIWERRE